MSLQSADVVRMYMPHRHDFMLMSPWYSVGLPKGGFSSEGVHQDGI